jgi:hypothetical protein
MKQYGIDIVSQMEKMLSDEIAKSIDKQIISDIFNMANSKAYKRKDKISNILDLLDDNRKGS